MKKIAFGNPGNLFRKNLLPSEISIYKSKGQIVEQGEAAQVNDAWWELKPTSSTKGKVLVEAFDLAGNCTKYEAV